MKDSRDTLGDALEPLAQKASGNAKALVMLAEFAASRNNERRAIELAQEALSLGLADRDTIGKAEDVIAGTVPDFHLPIVRDGARVRAFEEALMRAITPETRLLDVGSGSGLLAMFAAKAGARQIYSCEANPAVASVAAEIINCNGFADRIEILSKHSTELDVESDLHGQVDLVVAEIVGKDLVDELVLPAMQDVAKRLIRPGGKIIPERGDIRLALAWWDGLAERRFGVECGFDMTPFNRILPKRVALPCGDKGLTLRSEAASLFSFDFASTAAPPREAEVALTADMGPVNGVVQWIGLKMDGTAYYENRPQVGAQSSWACQFLPLSQPIEDAAGKVVKIGGAQANGNLNLWEA